MRARTRSIAVTTENHRSVFMEASKNAGRKTHLKTLRFGSRLIAGKSITITATGDADIVTDSDPTMMRQAIAGDNLSPRPGAYSPWTNFLTRKAAAGRAVSCRSRNRHTAPDHRTD